MTFDLIVVGGGPAGCSAAITAARGGAGVLLLERGRFPRHRVCGEFVSAESLDLLHHLLAPAHWRLISDAPRISRGRIFADGAELQAEISPAAASIARYDLDHALWKSCVQGGVETRHDCTVQAVKGDGPFTLTSQGEIFKARAVVNATGRWSNLASTAARASATSPMRKDRWIGVKAHFRENSAPNASSAREAAPDALVRGDSVDLYFFDGGYCGVQPVDLVSDDQSQNGAGTRINACAMVRADVATAIAEVLRRHPALLERSRSWQPLMEPVSTSPLVFHQPEPVIDSMLQAGDSATFVDPFVGDGISLALRSGALGAECLLPFFRGECTLAQAAEEYCALYKLRLASVFHASSRLRRMLNWPTIVRKPILSLLEKTPSLTRQLVKMTR
jgi:flavin-dependent dehydrogenase